MGQIQGQDFLVTNLDVTGRVCALAEYGLYAVDVDDGLYIFDRQGEPLVGNEKSQQIL